MNRRSTGLLFLTLGVAIALALLGVAWCLAGDESLREDDAVVHPVTFSAPSGFYDDDFYLTMDAGGNRIYYTLDSSRPTTHSLLYTGPILIQDASAKENYYSTITDVAPYFYPELLKKNNRSIGTKTYQVPKAPIDKATVIRAVSIDETGKRSQEVQLVYYVGFDRKSEYDGMNIMTIVTEPTNLFSYQRGIYVLGQIFADKVENGLYKGNDVTPSLWTANYRQRGLKWERKAWVSLYDENRDLVYSDWCGIRIQGHACRGLLPKSFNIFTREKYGSAQIDTQSLFGADYTLHSLTLSNGGQDINTLFKDCLVNTLAADLNVMTREYERCVLFLEGEYWGNYWLIPRFKKDYVSQKYGVEADNLIIIKKEQLEDGKDEDIDLYNDMIDRLCNTDMTVNENYEQIGEMLDIQSSIDYFALEIYLINQDWPLTNTALWRTRDRGKGLCADGKWRWIAYDFNSPTCMKRDSATMDLIQRTINMSPMFASLMANKDFESALYDRLVSLANDTFAPDKTDAYIEDYKQEMGKAMANHYERFYGDNRTVDDFYAGCDDLKQFFHDRHDYIIKTYGGNGNELS